MASSMPYYAKRTNAGGTGLSQDKVGKCRPGTTSSDPKTTVELVKQARRKRETQQWGNSSINLCLGVIIVGLHAYFLYAVQEQYFAFTGPEDPAFDWVMFFTPIFFITMMLEAGYSRLCGFGDLYRFNDFIGSLSLGSMQVLTKRSVVMLVGLFPYLYIWRNIRVTDYFISPGYTSFWLGFFGVEFCYYWVHRTGHTVNLFWAMHGVHHSSEKYNLSTALRQSSTHQLVTWIYYLPMAFILPPNLFLLQAQYNLLYQYWIHTECIGKLGPLEYILNTPSQHRVHHGRNAYCIDNNYGGTTCIFDRLFGTFAEEREDEPVVYGLTHAVNTFEPVNANAYQYNNILASMSGAKSWLDSLLVPYMGPGWIVGDYSKDNHYPIPQCHSVQEYNTRLSTRLKWYIFAMFMANSAFQVSIFQRLPHTEYSRWIAILSPFLLITLSSMGSLADRRPSAFWMELARLFLVVPFAALFISCLKSEAMLSFEVLESSPMVAVYVYAAVSLVVLWTCKSELARPTQEFEMGKHIGGE